MIKNLIQFTLLTGDAVTRSNLPRAALLRRDLHGELVTIGQPAQILHHATVSVVAHPNATGYICRMAHRQGSQNS